MAIRYIDDEPGSPWTWILYLDERATDEQRAALEAIFTGRLGGDAAKHFPWAWKASELVGVRSVAIEVDHTRAAPAAARSASTSASASATATRATRRSRA